MNEDEIAFYDAITADDTVKEFMEDETLKQIAKELTIYKEKHNHRLERQKKRPSRDEKNNQTSS